MKAIEINGEIQLYHELPKSWGGVMGNFSLLSEEEIKSYGFYDVIVPEHNSKVEQLSNIFWDADNEVFTYTVSDREWVQSLEEMKEVKINAIKVNAQGKLNKTDWYVTRKAEKNIDIPESITTERDQIKATVDIEETEINALTTKKSVVLYSSSV